MQQEIYEQSLNFSETDYTIQVGSLELVNTLLNGCKDKVQSNRLEDSKNPSTLPSPELPTESIIISNAKDSTSEESPKRGIDDAQDDESSNGMQNRFKSRKKRIRLLSQTEILLKELKADRKARQQEFEFIKKYLEDSKKQEDKFLDIMQQLLLDNKGRKN